MLTKQEEKALAEANRLIRDTVEDEATELDRKRLKSAYTFISSYLADKKPSKVNSFLKIAPIFLSCIALSVAYVQLNKIKEQQELNIQQQKLNITLEATSAIKQKYFSDRLTRIATATLYIRTKKHKQLNETLKSFYGNSLPVENTESLILDIYSMKRFFSNLVDLHAIGALNEGLVYIVAYNVAHDFLVTYNDCWKDLKLKNPEESHSLVILQSFMKKLSKKYKKQYPQVEGG